MFHDVQFPVNISYGAKGGPKFKTSIFAANGGHEVRNIEWSQARGEWSVGHDMRSQVDLDELLAFFYARNGRAYSFRFKDWVDYKARMETSESLPVLLTVASGGLPTAGTQLTKTYASGDFTYVRDINRPVEGTITLYANEVEISGTNYTIDYSTGLITWDGSYAPSEGTVIAWDGEFDVPVRFDTDHFEAEIAAFRRYNWQGVPIVEVRNEEDDA